jgi:hypothetical protein
LICREPRHQGDAGWRLDHVDARSGWQFGEGFATNSGATTRGTRAMRVDVVNDRANLGISAGPTFAVALEVAKKTAPGDVILAMLPDTGERYLSTILFEGVNEGSDEP